MALFRKREEDIDEEELEELEKRRFNRRKFKDLNPENKRKRKEPQKPWGKKERIIIFSILLLTVLTSFILDLSSRNFKLPGFPRFNLAKLNLDIFKGETIVVGNRQEDQVAMKAKVIKEFEEKTNKLSGVYALYVVNLDSNYSFGVNENEVMQAASLIKLPVMALVYKENLGEKYGSLVEAMGKRSDNAAFNTLVKYFGEEKIKNYTASLGMDQTSYEKNKTTAKNIGVFFQKLYQGQILPEGDKNKMLDFMTNTIFEKWMVAGIPEGVGIAHKYGREIHVVNDAGIVFTNKPFVLVLMSDGIVETEADKILPELAGNVYQEMVK